MKLLIFILWVVSLFYGVVHIGQAAPQATITVNTLTDDLLINQNCSLREAVLAANTNTVVDACAAGSGTNQADTITFAINGTIVLTHPDGELEIDESVIIEGNGRSLTIIDAQHGSRIFHITAGRATTLRAMTLQNGATGLYGGGAVRNAGSTLFLDDVLVQDSLAAGNFVSGGGISSSGELTITDSTIQTNSAEFSNGGGGGIEAYGTVEIHNSIISGNSANGTEEGSGGILFESGVITITHSLIISNTAEASSFGGGGGLRILGGGEAIINESTISDNEANDGGGIHCVCPHLSLADSTISHNSASDGGGVYCDCLQLDIAGSTIHGNNSVHHGGGIYLDTGKPRLSTARSAKIQPMLAVVFVPIVFFIWPLLQW